MEDDTIAPTVGKVCSCGSDDLGAEELRPGQSGYGTHHGKFVCCRCGRFNGWVPNPHLTAAVVERAGQIKALLNTDKLSGWERQFIQSISRQRPLTDKQQGIWKRILAQAAN